MDQQTKPLKHRLPKYLHAFHDRHGKQRLYYREPGKGKTPLPGPLYSEAFWIAYHKAKDGQPVSAGKPPKQGTIRHAVTSYYTTAEYTTLAKSTQDSYRRTLDKWCESDGDGPIAGLETKHVNRMIDKMAETPAAANLFRKRVSLVFKHAISEGLANHNPAKDAKRLKQSKVGYRTWTDGDIEAYRAHWAEGKAERIAFEILLHTGLRRSDAVRLGWQHLKGDAFVMSTKKSQGEVELHIPVHRDLSFLFGPTEG